STAATVLGAPSAVAAALQAMAALAAAAMVWRAFRSKADLPTRLGVLLCATLLASPHLSSYDMVLLALAGLLAFLRPSETVRPLALLLALAAWVAPLLGPPRANPVG